MLKTGLCLAVYCRGIFIIVLRSISKRSLYLYLSLNINSISIYILYKPVCPASYPQLFW